MTPYQTANTKSLEAVYNLKHAKARNVIRRAISVLKHNFRCLLNTQPLYYKPLKVIKIVNVCAALYNICLEYGCNIEDVNEETENHLDGAEENETTESTQSIEAHEIREEIKNSFK